MATNGSSNGTTTIQRKIIKGNEELRKAILAEASEKSTVSAPAKHVRTLTVELVPETKSLGTSLVNFLKSLDLKVCFGIGIVHAFALVAIADMVATIAYMVIGSYREPIFFTWSGFAVFCVMYVLTGGGGITLCFHRLLTHRSFETTPAIRYFLTLLGAIAWQGPPIHWVAVHRKHHQYSDEDGDPHSPNQGTGLLHAYWFLWAHTFWFLFKPKPGEDVDDRYAPDLKKDPGIKIINDLFWLPQILLIFLLFGLGYLYGDTKMAWSWVIMGVPLRIVAVLHATWLVNSAAHTWGYQTFKDTGDKSRNNWWVSLFAFGEGWHNNHHAIPQSATHGMGKYEVDVTFMVIRILGRLGLAWNIVMPDRSRLYPHKREKETAGTGSAGAD